MRAQKLIRMRVSKNQKKPAKAQAQQDFNVTRGQYLSLICKGFFECSPWTDTLIMVRQHAWLAWVFPGFEKLLISTACLHSIPKILYNYLYSVIRKHS